MSEKALQVFAYKEHEVRTTEIDGETWWVAKDVCNILELSDVSMATQPLDDDEKGTSKVCTPGGIQNMTVINESGLYTLLIQLALALDKVHKSYTGRSALEAGEIALIAPSKKQILTPTEIGEHFNLNARRVNEILAGAGYQHRINNKWEALPPGEAYAVMLDTGKKNGNGTPVRQLKWDSSILTVFTALLN